MGADDDDGDTTRHRREVHHEADVVIVGAGILGCAMAATMGKQGRSVLLLERSLKEPDRIVGELLQPGGVAALEMLGLRGAFLVSLFIPITHHLTWELHQIAWMKSIACPSKDTRSSIMAKP